MARSHPTWRAVCGYERMGAAIKGGLAARLFVSYQLPWSGGAVHPFLENYPRGLAPDATKPASRMAILQ